MIKANANYRIRRRVEDGVVYYYPEQNITIIWFINFWTKFVDKNDDIVRFMLIDKAMSFIDEKHQSTTLIDVIINYTPKYIKSI